MHVEIQQVEGNSFRSNIRDHVLYMDTPLSQSGTNKGPTPKELLLSGIIGCAGMDVVALLKKYKMAPDLLKISADTDTRKEHPRIFTKVETKFFAEGNNVGAKELKEAVELSLTKYCGVTAMVSKTVPVHYEIFLNGTSVGQGSANFGSLI
jgi:putative redox protein